MGVTLRKRKNADNTTSLILDIYHNGRRKYEFLQHLKLITKPATPEQRKNNKDNLELAKKIETKKRQELEGGNYDVTVNFKQNVYFLEYYQNFIDKYKKKDKRVIEASFNQFKNYLKEAEIKDLTARQLDASIVAEFKNYLIENLNGESPANYYKKFKMVVKQAIKQNIIFKDPTIDIRIKVEQEIKKKILSPEEYQLLAKTPITNKEVKNAFFFSLYTGLRFCDIVAIRWQNIDFINNRLEFNQAKTGKKVELNLHPTALSVLGKPKNNKDFVFNLPSHTACSKGLKVWVKKAGINKHITWHCSRHSFATNLIYFGADVNTASSLLGHSNLRYTERYTHIVDSLKEKAISNLPETTF